MTWDTRPGINGYIEKLRAENERLRAVLLNIAHMDVYTRKGEEPAAEVMRASAKEALEQKSPG